MGEKTINDIAPPGVRNKSTTETKPEKPDVISVANQKASEAYPESRKGIGGIPPVSTPKEEKRKKQRVFGGIDRETSEYFLDSMSMLMLAGVTVGDALESIANEIPRKNIRELFLKMRTSVDDGTLFSRAIEQTGLFGPSVITLIEIGESTGRLPQNLRVVADQMHKNNQMNARIKSAMIYPGFLISLLFIVGTGVGVFLLPKLLTTITSLNEPVGPITDALIYVGTFFAHFGLVFAGVVVMLATAIGIGIKMNDNVKAASEAIIYRIPGIKKLLFETEVARFGFILGTLLEAGLPVVTALQSLSGSMATKRYQKFASDLKTKIDEGNSFGKVLVEPRFKKMLSGTICQIIISAEKSGTLAPSLLKIGDNYQDKADITARNLETMLEPIVLVLIAVAVLFVAVAVFLPIYSLIGNFNSSGNSGS
jgi:type IV pilus assembly protein PilC